MVAFCSGCSVVDSMLPQPGAPEITVKVYDGPPDDAELIYDSESGASVPSREVRELVTDISWVLDHLERVGHTPFSPSSPCYMNLQPTADEPLPTRWDRELKVMRIAEGHATLDVVARLLGHAAVQATTDFDQNGESLYLHTVFPDLLEAWVTGRWIVGEHSPEGSRDLTQPTTMTPVRARGRALRQRPDPRARPLRGGRRRPTGAGRASTPGGCWTTCRRTRPSRCSNRSSLSPRTAWASGIR